MKERIKQVHKFGQSIWLDYIRRKIIMDGTLKEMVDNDGVTGVTSNPTIFEKAINGSDDYDEALETLLESDSAMDAKTLYEHLAVDDIQRAADILRPVFNQTGGEDGFVSMEVSPYLAHYTEKTISEARRLWRVVDRPNLMIKVPATLEGIPAIETLTGDGINVNATLMFSLDHYEAVAGAYIRGLERCHEPSRVASVASFFVSRVDTAVDRALEQIGSEDALELRGKAAIANSKTTYQRFHEIFSGELFASLRDKGAKVQRVLWGSTGTKNPAYSDVYYVEELIGPDTVNTIPPATLEAFRDHGRVRLTLEKKLDDAEDVLRRLKAVGIDLGAITEKLQVSGVESFSDSFDKLLTSLEQKCQSIRKEKHLEAS